MRERSPEVVSAAHAGVDHRRADLVRSQLFFQQGHPARAARQTVPRHQRVAQHQNDRSLVALGAARAVVWALMLGGKSPWRQPWRR